MHKSIDLKLTSVYSPIAQALINESYNKGGCGAQRARLDNCNELLIIRMHGTVIGYALFYLIDGEELVLESIYVRGIIKNQTLGEYWLSRLIERYLKKIRYNQFLLAS